ncbi:GvpL/GvpF family gas vesicle protein [Jatrophihabitans sp.]|uniref:GvpL/GvpF family gas vesicle protein n=1 Tax=Jatrophihabitans sp. TaxID=1932789 RepID=UPI002B60C650|nr:GvpL/GvpF family gas vesicle protein [Jatrophihabitans sp.]
MSALYVYGIVDTGPPASLADGQAVGGAPADTIDWLTDSDLPVSAVVSPAPDDLRGKRRDLLAHQRVLDLLAEHGPVLPMRFGVVAPDEQTLLESLRGNAERYTRLLRELAGRVELNVKALPDEQQFIASASNDPAVRSALQAARRDGSHERQVQLGQAVATAVAQRRQLCGAQLLDRLHPLASRTATLAAGDKYVLNAAFLVERSAVDGFTDAVDELRAQLSPAVDLVLTGPLPPYSFVGD